MLNIKLITSPEPCFLCYSMSRYWGRLILHSLLDTLPPIGESNNDNPEASSKDEGEIVNPRKIRGWLQRWGSVFVIVNSVKLQVREEIFR